MDVDGEPEHKRARDSVSNGLGDSSDDQEQQEQQVGHSAVCRRDPWPRTAYNLVAYNSVVVCLLCALLPAYKADKTQMRLFRPGQ